VFHRKSDPAVSGPVRIDEHWPGEYEPDWDALKSAESEDAFGEAAFELFTESTMLAAIAASIVPAHPLRRDEAILSGLLVKVAKLGKVIVAMSAHLGADRQLALFRELLEALASLWYLLDDSGDASRFQAYVLNSLVAERQLGEVVSRNIEKRGGESLPIEVGMKRSIDNTTAAAGLDGLDSATRAAGWPSAEKLIGDLGSDVYLAYRAGSSVVHSQWADLMRNHLVRSSDSHFELRLEDLPPKPQPLYAGAALIVRTMGHYLAKERSAAVELFGDRLSSLEQRIERLAQMHGGWDDAGRAADYAPQPTKSG
jgi:hypothetical protein